MKIAALAASGWLVVLAGCGLAANPQPPTLRLPKPVNDLRAARVGDEVQIRWRMPRHTTDNVELRGPQRARICWMRPQTQTVVFDSRLCRMAGSESFEPDKPAEFSVALPAELTEGAPGTVAFFVELENAAGKTAGPSNAAWSVTGAAPPAVTGLDLKTVPDGVVLHWTKGAPEPETSMRIARTLITPPKAPTPNQKNGAPPIQEQTLEVDLSHEDPGGAVDHDASFDQLYRYTAQRVERVTVDGRKLELAGVPSEPATIDAKDVFPPAVPAGLAAVADEQARSIGLSWRPDSDADLAGYVVYRRDLSAGTNWERISGHALLVPPSFEDRNITVGHQYAYAVTSVDQDGNESVRSAEVTEELPPS
ncbi:MAG: fibronectin type III domain-containing protein [Acidobacteriaceae bacterium]